MPDDSTMQQDDSAMQDQRRDLLSLPLDTLHLVLQALASNLHAEVAAATLACLAGTCTFLQKIVHGEELKYNVDKIDNTHTKCIVRVHKSMMTDSMGYKCIGNEQI